MNVRQAERFLKRIRKYSVEGKALKMKMSMSMSMSMKEHASPYGRFHSEARFAEVQTDYRAAEIFVRDIR